MRYEEGQVVKDRVGKVTKGQQAKGQLGNLCWSFSLSQLTLLCWLLITISCIREFLSSLILEIRAERNSDTCLCLPWQVHIRMVKFSHATNHLEQGSRNLEIVLTASNFWHQSDSIPPHILRMKPFLHLFKIG